MHDARLRVGNRRGGDVRGLVALSALSASLTVGCGRQAIATTDALPVTRVVVYRNGVAYFERAGHVDDSEVRFKMKRTEVGDFLATLAVMERGGSSVRAAAFPLQVDDDNEEAKAPPEAGHEPSEDEKKGLETVVLSLDGKAHDLQVGLRRRVAGVAPVVSPRGPLRGRRGLAGVGHRPEPLGRGLEEREALAHRRRAARVRGGARDAGHSAAPDRDRRGRGHRRGAARRDVAAAGAAAPRPPPALRRPMPDEEDESAPPPPRAQAADLGEARTRRTRSIGCALRSGRRRCARRRRLLG